MNLPLLNQFLLAASLAIGIINALWIWLSRPARDLSARIAKVAQDAKGEVDALASEMNGRGDRHRENLKEHDRRIQRLEDQVPHLPTREDLHEIGKALTAVQTQMAGITGTVTRIDDFLRNRP